VFALQDIIQLLALCNAIHAFILAQLALQALNAQLATLLAIDIFQEVPVFA